jgi:hypothetical protein
MLFLNPEPSTLGRVHPMGRPRELSRQGGRREEAGGIVVEKHAAARMGP